jgi:uncharacterized repeat protein (TIGR03803 family)
MSPQLTSILSFNGTNGEEPRAKLTIDANGNLIGTTESGGATNQGTVFEIENIGTTAAPKYASAPTTLVNFNGTNGSFPLAGLTADAAGNLIGTTEAGGVNNAGTVFELINIGTATAPNYASAPTTLVNFNTTNGEFPFAQVHVDAAGNLIGTTFEGGTNTDGTVFEIQNTGTVAAPNYANAPTTLVNFNATNGAFPSGSLIADAHGDLFGTTENGGTNGDGTVFELLNNGTAAAPSYASAPTTLVSFNTTNGAFPEGGLTLDAAGNLIGTTDGGGTTNQGTVFELINNGTAAAPSYGSAPTTLVNFNGTDGDSPNGELTVDVHGNLFGTTEEGGTSNQGTVYELKNTGTVAAPVYSSTPITLANFNGANGEFPLAGLTEDVSGNLLGTTFAGGVSVDGTVFSVSGATVTNFSVLDTTTNTPSQTNGTPYSGPVAGLQQQLIDTATDNLNVTANVANVFIHTGSGFDAIDVSQVGGTNVLDGGTNSNFLVGGMGAGSNDTFFVDDRNPSSDIWSTVANFHAGDSATVFGITKTGFNTSFVDGQGATGFTGLTLHVTDAGHPTASLTLAGFSTADLSNGRISTSFGTEADGTPYLFVHANS